MRRAASRGASRSIGWVSRPVNVFCWLGWYEPTTTKPPARATAPCPNAGRGRASSPVSAAIVRNADSHAIAPSATRTRTSARSASSRTRNGRQVRPLLGRRLVGRRRAAHGGRDVRVAECQAVASPAPNRLIRQPDRVHRLEQEVARGVAGEDAAGPVATVGGRRQARRSGSAPRDRRSRARAGPSTSRPGTGRPSRPRRARARRPTADMPGRSTISAVRLARPRPG